MMKMTMLRKCIHAGLPEEKGEIEINPQCAENIQ
jgi:hypothetical protein